MSDVPAGEGAAGSERAVWHGVVGVVTGDLPPVAGMAANGAGLRAWGIAAALQALGIDAKLLFPREHLPRGGRPTESWCWPVRRERLLSLATNTILAAGDREGGGDDSTTAAAPLDALIYQHWGLLSEGLEGAQAARGAVPLAIDLAGPHLLERAYWRHPDGAASFGRKRRALEAADFVTFASDRQAAWFAPFLTEAWGSPESAIPIGLATIFSGREAIAKIVDERNESAAGMGIAAADRLGRCDFWFGEQLDSIAPLAIAPAQRPLLVFSGAFLPWQDATWAIERALAFLDGLGRGELLVVGTELPFVDGGDGARRLARLVGRHPRARRLGRIPFERVVAILRAADASLDIMATNPERVLASPIRTALALWLGTPILFNDYGAEAAAVRAAGGWAIAPGDDRALDAALTEIAGRSGAPVRAPRRAAPSDAVGDLAQWLMRATNVAIQRDGPAAAKAAPALFSSSPPGPEAAPGLSADQRGAVSRGVGSRLGLASGVIAALEDGHRLVQQSLVGSPPGESPHAAGATAASVTTDAPRAAVAPPPSPFAPRRRTPLRRLIARAVSPFVAAAGFGAALLLALITPPPPPPPVQTPAPPRPPSPLPRSR
jgi:hypothetical protein